MTGFGTNQEAMATSAAKVDDATQAVQGHIGTLRTEVETMLGGWGGDAASAFGNLHANFETQANRINNALRGMHEALVSTHSTYANQEQQQTDTLTGFAGQINA